jgi:predicted double-glycine peptidase
LLNYYLDTPTSEQEIARLSGANQYGTTFAGLEYAAEAKGAGADSFRMTLTTLRQQLEAYPAPLLVRLLLPQPHFVLVLGIDGDTILMADPGSNNVMMPQKAFLQRWLVPGSEEGYVFVAARADGRTNVARRDQIVAELRRGKQQLGAQRLAPVMRR